MAIEVREERPQERRFIIQVDSWSKYGSYLTEPELGELVEKGAKALGITVYSSGALMIAPIEKEVWRLRAWLKAIESDKGFEGACLKYMAARALAGEEAPKP